jgi:Na+-transporting NADH:ubiquinone oxidoreductase subunit NqrC
VVFSPVQTILKKQHFKKDGAMKITLLVTLLFGLVFVTALSAAEKTLTPQQQRMTLCNQQAKVQTLTGEARKRYMSDCLKNTKTEPGQKSLSPQQQKMRECNSQATQQSLKGEDRSKFMSACLKKTG